MSNIFLENLDHALDEVQMSHIHCENIESAVANILDIKEQLDEAEKELLNCIDKMCAELSTEIRKLQPGLTVTLKTRCCEVGYRTRAIQCVVKPYDGCWNFDSSDFGRHFTRKYPQCCKLNCSLPELASCLVSYFQNHFRSL